MTQANTSYFQRCQQWLAQTNDIPAQTLVETIAKFTQQLESLDETQQALADDLMATLDILNDALMSLEEQGQPVQVNEAQVNAPQAASQPEAVLESPTVNFDSSSLQFYDNAEVQTLSQQERQHRLQALLAETGISRGMPPKPD
ncbi:hypothetical protein R50073_08400 [Maricurvus nonylphenolicus]|uniref:hypothetical protein n=1 Tax=Maricurvus nonylphenolicus TaxID=1008307 RepID=UPI0036F2B9BF